MKGGLTAIQQTLTPESSTVLTRSIAEATRRNHAQTTPLHVAATLLADPSGLLRHACLRSHPTTPNPLHTRALDLCFSVALDRLPTTTTTTTTDSTLSNALMAALKRAQAHQRRGCPEQQQPPLLAVKVELDQLIISILDDPSVSRVMREASFSSPAVKLTIEQFNTAPTRNLYINPLLDRRGQNHDEDVNRVLEILSRSKKQNPVLVGDSNLDAIMLEVLQKIRDTAHVISLANKFESLDRSKIPSAIVEFGYLLEKQNHAGVVLDLGDLKWLGEGIMAETGRAAVVEMSRILARFREAATGTCRLWIIGTATCATYLRCQVYHPSMEKDWDLQAVPIGHRSPISGGHPRLGGSGILIRSVESLTSSRGFLLRSPQIEQVEISKRSSLCDECNKSYKVELAMLKPTTESLKVLPHWLQNTKEEELVLKQKTEKLMNKCLATCSRLHSNPSERSLDRKSRMSIYLNENQIETDLVLGPPKKAPESLPHEKNNVGFMDSDSPKKLLNGLTEKVSWQMDAAAAVAAAITSRNEKWRGIVPKADSWLLFIGPDRIGKKKMASALSELMFGAAPVTIRLGGPTIDEDDGESDISLRGKTPIDKVAEALRRNPFSLILLEDVDNADALMLRALKQAMERGRLLDSYGREVGLGSVIFVLTADWLPENLKESQDALLHREEEEILKSAKFGTQLEISIEVISGKRKAERAMKEDQPMKKASGFGLSLDLNLAVGGDDDGEGSSDLTVENEHDYGSLLQVKNASPSVSSELIESVDETIMFKPVDFRPLRRRIWESINTKFMGIMGSGRVIKIDDEVVDQLVGGVWLGGAGSVFDEWAERVLVPGIQRLRRVEKVCDGAVIQLTASNGGERRRRSSRAVDWMPSRLTVCGV